MSENRFHAQSYGHSVGFYFTTYQEYLAGYKKYEGISEEYELQFIDGDEGVRLMFNGLNICQSNIERFLELIEDICPITDEEYAIDYLICHSGSTGEDLWEMMEDKEYENVQIETESKYSVGFGILKDHFPDLYKMLDELHQIDNFNVEALVDEWVQDDQICELSHGVWVMNAHEYNGRDFS